MKHILKFIPLLLISIAGTTIAAGKAILFHNTDRNCELTFEATKQSAQHNQIVTYNIKPNFKYQITTLYLGNPVTIKVSDEADAFCSPGKTVAILSNDAQNANHRFPEVSKKRALNVKCDVEDCTIQPY